MRTIGWVPAVFALACARKVAPVEAPPPDAQLRFLPAAPSMDGLDVTVSEGWTWGAASGAVQIQPVARAGARIGETVFGALVDAGGNPLVGPAGERPWLSDALDFVALHDVAGVPTLLTHVESRPSALYRTELDLGADGRATPLSTSAVDLSAVRGSWNLCAGDVTPWGTHLAGEEFEPEAPCIDVGGHWALCERTSHADAFERSALALAPADRPLWAYDHGWMLEVALTPHGAVPHRRPALGRFSHEIGVVLPDARTVLLTDDLPTGGGIFLFVGDRPQDLSSGTLYAARWTAGAVDWVSLGHADEADLATVFEARTLGFEDLMTLAPVPSGGQCGAGTRRVLNATHPELPAEVCLGVRDLARATRFETRRAAAWLGATLEFTKAEGAAVDRDGRRVFVAMSSHQSVMADGLGHLAVPPNPCGAVWAFTGLNGGAVDTDGAPMASDWVPRRFEPVWEGVPDGSACADDRLANPDNLAFIDGHGLLLVAEDTRRHQRPTLWAWEPDRPAVPAVSVAQAPVCGEWSGLHVFPRLFGQGWVTVSLQHAFVDTDDAGNVTCGDASKLDTVPISERSWAGLIGPLPPLDGAPPR